MTGFHAHDGLGSSLSPARTRLENHPVYAVLPSAVQVVLTETADRLSLDAGDALPKDSLFFIMNGAIGFFPSRCGVCVGIVPPGSVAGWEALISAAINAPQMRALLPVDGYVAPLNTVQAVLKGVWIYRFLAAHAGERARVLGVEASCNARHTAVQRLAKWIARFNAASGGEESEISITQSELAKLLGLQRTSVNVACRYLQDRGALRIRRARVIVIDQDELAEASCNCDARLADSTAERRHPIRLN